VSRPTVEQLRAIGLEMRGVHMGYHLGWTTDETQAEAARALGATVTRCSSPRPDASGWEIATSRKAT